jgi:hypothetical protein
MPVWVLAEPEHVSALQRGYVQVREVFLNHSLSVMLVRILLDRSCSRQRVLRQLCSRLLNLSESSNLQKMFQAALPAYEQLMCRMPRQLFIMHSRADLRGMRPGVLLGRGSVQVVSRKYYKLLEMFERHCLRGL